MAVIRRNIRFVSFTTLLLFATSASADFSAGVAAYERGDYETAFKEFKHSADQGHAPAQHKLGWLYDQGHGAARDYARVAKWRRKAATQGHAYGQYNLAKAYETGQGAPQDYVQANMWMSLAATHESGEEKCMYLLARDAIAKNMSKRQIAEAERLAAVWTPQRK